MIDSYNEVLKSIENIVKNVANKMGFDKTVLGVITKCFEYSPGNYLVKIDNVEFEAISSLINLKVGDYVYITIPNGDYTETKIITGKKQEEKVEQSVKPRDQIVGLNELNIDLAALDPVVLDELSNKDYYIKQKSTRDSYINATDNNRLRFTSAIQFKQKVEIKCKTGYNFAIYKKVIDEDENEFFYFYENSPTGLLQEHSESDTLVWLNSTQEYILNCGNDKCYLYFKYEDDSDFDLDSDFDIKLLTITPIGYKFNINDAEQNIITLYPEWLNLISDTYKDQLEKINDRFNNRWYWRDMQIRHELYPEYEHKRLILPEVSFATDVIIRCNKSNYQTKSDYQFAIYRREEKTKGKSNYYFYAPNVSNKLIEQDILENQENIPWLNTNIDYLLPYDKNTVYQIYLKKYSYDLTQDFIVDAEKKYYSVQEEKFETVFYYKKNINNIYEFVKRSNLQSNEEYYTIDANSFEEVINPNLVDINTYYEIIDEHYELTTDIAIDSTKHYFKPVKNSFYKVLFHIDNYYEKNQDNKYVLIKDTSIEKAKHKDYYKINNIYFNEIINLALVDVGTSYNKIENSFWYLDENFSDLFTLTLNEDKKNIDQSQTYLTIPYYPLDLYNQRYQKFYFRCDFISNILATTGSYKIKLDFIAKDEDESSIQSFELPHTLITGNPYNSIIPSYIESCFDVPLELLVNQFKNLYKINISFIFGNKIDDNFYNDFYNSFSEEIINGAKVIKGTEVVDGFITITNLNFILGFDAQNYKQESIIDIYPIDQYGKKQFFSYDFYYTKETSDPFIGIDILQFDSTKKTINRIKQFDKDKDKAKIGWYEYSLGAAPNDKNLDGEKNDLLKEINWKETELDTNQPILKKSYKYQCLNSLEINKENKRIIIPDLELLNDTYIKCKTGFKFAIYENKYENIGGIDKLKHYFYNANSDNSLTKQINYAENVDDIVWLNSETEYFLEKSTLIKYNIYIKKDIDDSSDEAIFIFSDKNDNNILDIRNNIMSYKRSSENSTIRNFLINNINKICHNFKLQKQVQNSKIQVKANINNEIITSNTLIYFNSDSNILKNRPEEDKIYLYTDDNYNGIYNIYNIDKTIIEAFNQKERTVRLIGIDDDNKRAEEKIKDWYLINLKGEKIKLNSNIFNIPDTNIKILSISDDKKELKFKLQDTIQINNFEYICCKLKLKEKNEQLTKTLKQKVNNKYNYRPFDLSHYENENEGGNLPPDFALRYVLPFSFDGEIKIKNNNINNIRYCIARVKEENDQSLYIFLNKSISEDNLITSFDINGDTWINDNSSWRFNCEKNEKYIIYLAAKTEDDLNNLDFEISSNTWFKYYPINCGFFNTNGSPYNFSLVMDQSQRVRTFPFLKLEWEEKKDENENSILELQSDEIDIIPKIFNAEGYDITENVEEKIQWEIINLKEQNSEQNKLYDLIKIAENGNLVFKCNAIPINKITLEINQSNVLSKDNLLQNLKKYGNYSVLQATVNYNGYNLITQLPIGLTTNKDFLFSGPLCLNYTSENEFYFDYGDIPFQQLNFEENKKFSLQSPKYKKINIDFDNFELQGNEKILEQVITDNSNKFYTDIKEDGNKKFINLKTLYNKINYTEIENKNEITLENFKDNNICLQIPIKSKFKKEDTNYDFLKNLTNKISIVNGLNDREGGLTLDLFKKNQKCFLELILLYLDQIKTSNDIDIDIYKGLFNDSDEAEKTQFLSNLIIEINNFLQDVYDYAFDIQSIETPIIEQNNDSNTYKLIFSNEFKEEKKGNKVFIKNIKKFIDIKGWNIPFYKVDEEKKFIFSYSELIEILNMVLQDGKEIEAISDKDNSLIKIDLLSVDFSSLDQPNKDIIDGIKDTINEKDKDTEHCYVYMHYCFIEWKDEESSETIIEPEDPGESEEPIDDYKKLINFLSLEESEPIDESTQKIKTFYFIDQTFLQTNDPNTTDTLIFNLLNTTLADFFKQFTINSNTIWLTNNKTFFVYLKSFFYDYIINHIENIFEKLSDDANNTLGSILGKINSLKPRGYQGEEYLKFDFSKELINKINLTDLLKNPNVLKIGKVGSGDPRLGSTIYSIIVKKILLNYNFSFGLPFSYVNAGSENGQFKFLFENLFKDCNIYIIPSSYTEYLNIINKKTNALERYIPNDFYFDYEDSINNITILKIEKMTSIYNGLYLKNAQIVAAEKSYELLNIYDNNFKLKNVSESSEIEKILSNNIQINTFYYDSIIAINMQSKEEYNYYYQLDNQNNIDLNKKLDYNIDYKNNIYCLSFFPPDLQLCQQLNKINNLNYNERDMWVSFGQSREKYWYLAQVDLKKPLIPFQIRNISYKDIYISSTFLENIDSEQNNISCQNKYIYTNNNYKIYINKSSSEESPEKLFPTDVENIKIAINNILLEDWLNNIFVVPIIYSINTFPVSLINTWDQSTQVQDAGYILSTQAVFGQKIDGKHFTGLLIEKPIESMSKTDLSTSSVGLYGFMNGEKTFSLTDNGLLSLGKEKNKQIILNGQKGIVNTNNYIEQKQGFLLDLSNGYLDSYNFSLKSKNITLISNTTENNYMSIINNSDKQLLNIGDNNYSLTSSTFNDYQTSGGHIDLNTGTLISQNGSIIVESNIVNYITSLYYRALLLYKKASFSDINDDEINISEKDNIITLKENLINTLNKKKLKDLINKFFCLPNDFDFSTDPALKIIKNNDINILESLKNIKFYIESDDIAVEESTSTQFVDSKDINPETSTIDIFYQTIGQKGINNNKPWTSENDEIDAKRKRENELKCHLYFRNELKLSDSVICGILANIEAESDYDEQCETNGMAYGLFQWWGSLTSNDSRRKNLFNYCNTQTPTTDQQLNFLKYELENYYYFPSLLAELQEKSKTDLESIEKADYAARLWFTKFEAVDNTKWNSSESTRRANQARAYYTFFTRPKSEPESD